MSDKPSKLRLAWTAGRLAARQVVGGGTGARALELSELLTDQLDQAKGLAMKVGQIVSYMGVPLSAPVQAKLARLQTGQRGMSSEQLREAIVRGLGAPADALFDAFDPAPIAAASIGQVHRATLSGEPVAVKVQYPDVAGTFDSDLGVLTRVASLASLASAVDGTAIVRELAARLEEECDYPREARMQGAFARAFADDPDAVVPEVVGSHSSATVLTSRWVDGESFDALCAHGAASRRDAAAAILMRFTYRSLLGLAAVQADPHPGNFLFLPDGRVAFLDFGCVRTFDVALVEQLRAMVGALRGRDKSRFREATLALGLVGRPKRFDYEHFFEVMEHLHRPLLAERFRFTPQYVHEGYAHNGPTSPNSRNLSIPPAYVWVMRLQWGLWSILARLGASVSFAETLDSVLAEPVRPLAVNDA